MGIVFLAQEVARERLVAIKLLPAPFAGRADDRLRFLREARTAAGLAHPNIVAIHSVDQLGDVVFFVMEYVPGESLGARLRRVGALPHADALRITREVAGALAIAHMHGIIHRDVKPDNILLAEGSDRAVVTDFGIARAPATHDASESSAIGTLHYMSPEQALGEPVDERTDVYALGVLAFHAVTGRRPFEAHAAGAVITQQTQREPPAIATVAPDLDPHFAHAIDRAIRHDPADRWPGVAAMADELGRAAARTRPGWISTVKRWIAARRSARSRHRGVSMNIRCTVAFLAALATPLAAQQHYQRQPGVDVQHYIWAITLSDSTDEISGEATVMVKFDAGIRSVFFDLSGRTAAGRRGMIVTAVRTDSTPLRFTHADNRVTITLPAATRAGGVQRFTIAYHGFVQDSVAPGGRGGGGGAGLWIGKNQFGERAFFSRNWPDAAHSWLPSIDHPSDKATSEFIVTAPEQYSVVANGLLQEELPLGNGRKRTHWKQSVPIAMWLNNIGVERFGVHHAGLVKGVDLTTWAPHQALDNAVASLELAARQSIEFFSEYVGPYAYEKMASVAAAGGGGGMEHASAIFYGESSANGRPATSLVAHETAHQWFGDAVTENEWDDVWLSEGFATYFAHLFTEHYSGRDAFLAGIAGTRKSALAAEKSQKKPLVHQNPNGTGPDLTGLHYQKGSAVLQVLRGEIGTDNFWKGIQLYYARHRDGTATSDDLRRAMEAVSARDLGWFFTQWLTRVDSPVVTGDWSWDPSGGLVVNLSQTQAGAPYRLTLELQIMPDSGAPRIEKVEMTQPQQRFVIAAAKSLKDVVLDPNSWILMDARFARRP